MSGRRLPRPSPLGVFGCLVLLFLYAPILLVVQSAFNSSKRSIDWEGFTTQWVEDALGNSRVLSDLGTSLWIAVVTAAISVALAVGVSLWWHRAGRRPAQVADLTTYARIVLPEIVFALALLTLFSELDLPLGAAAIIAGQVVFTAAIATLLIRARLETIGNAYEDAAADLGASPWRTIRRVTLPLLAPALGAAAIVSFTFSFDDVVTPSFMGGSSTETLPVLIFGLARRGATAEVYAIALIAVVVTVVLLAAAWLVGGRQGVRALAAEGEELEKART